MATTLKLQVEKSFLEYSFKSDAILNKSDLGQAATGLADDVKRTMDLLCELQGSFYRIKTLPFINVRRGFKENCEILHGYLQKCRDFGADVFTLELSVGHEPNEDLEEFLREVKARAQELEQVFWRVKRDVISGVFLNGTTMNPSGVNGIFLIKIIGSPQSSGQIEAFRHKRGAK